MSNERAIAIDVGKGVGILLVVLAHNGLVEHELATLDTVIRSFRLPFFFFLSGAIFPFRRSTLELAVGRAHAWLKPFALVVLALGVVQLLEGTSTPEAIALGLLYGTGFTLSWVPMWFLPHLWLVSSAASLIQTRLPQLSSTLGRRCVLVATMLATGFFLLSLFHTPIEDPACREVRHFDLAILRCGLPLSGDLLLLTGSYFLLGHYLSDRVKHFRPNMPAFAAVALLFGLLCAMQPDSLNFNMRSYGNPIVSTAKALLGIYLLLSTCAWLACVAPLARLLAYVGKASLFVLIFHFFFELRLYDPLVRASGSAWLAGSASLAGSVAVCLALWEFTKRVRPLRAWLLPTGSSSAGLLRERPGATRSRRSGHEALSSE